jgi:ring-1,2-phenylacetyl-CoA epoxidase subunit PaaE
VRIEQISHAMLCGPDTLIKTAMQTLQKLGVPRERIGFEFFVRGREERAPRVARTAGGPAQAAEAQGSVLVVTLDGTRRTIRMRPDETVLQAALRGGVNAPYSCTGGMCCTCRAKLVEGTAPMSANFSLEAWEEAAGFILTCQARPTSPRVVVDYDQV